MTTHNISAHASVNLATNFTLKHPSNIYTEGLRLSYSTRELLRTCARKMEFRKLYEYGNREDSEAGDVGICFHKAIQTFLTTNSKTEAVKSLLLSYPIKYNLRPMQERSLEICYLTLLAVMDNEQFSRYQLAWFEINGIGKPAVEVPFSFLLNKSLSNPLSGTLPIPIKYVGYIDAIFYDTLTDSYIIFDIKTTRQNMSDYSPLFKFSNQDLPYALALEHLLGKKIKKLRVIYLVIYIDALVPRVLFYEFEKNEQDIQDWGRGLAVDIQNLQLYYANNWFPRSGKCYAWNKICPHFDYCESRDPEYISQRLYLAHDGSEAPPPFKPWFEIEFNM